MSVADRIVGDIAAAGWPVGEVVGYEGELLERYGVSRDVLREAVRLVEHLQVARHALGSGRPGRAARVGRVDRPTPCPCTSSTSEPASTTCSRSAWRSRSWRPSSLPIDSTRVGWTISRVLIAAGGRRRRAGSSSPPLAHRRRVRQHRALSFLIELLNQVTLLFLPSAATRMSQETLHASAEAHAAIVDAVLAGDAGRARRRMSKHLRAEAAFLRARPSRRRLGDLPQLGGRSNKRAEMTASNDLPRRSPPQAGRWGRYLGSEAELIERSASAEPCSARRCALLDHHQVARMRRGPGGGLFVVEPGVEAVTEAVALHVDRIGMIPATDLFEVRGDPRDRGSGPRHGQPSTRRRRRALLAALDAERSATPSEFAVVGHDLHAVLASIAGNPVLELLVLVLVRLTRFHAARPADAAADARPTEEATAVHERIVEAIISGDVDLARHRMRRHLDALSRWVR